MKKLTIQKVKQFLKDNGYYTDNLWQTLDIKQEFSEVEKMKILNKALQNEDIMEQIWLAINNEVEKLIEEENQREIVIVTAYILREDLLCGTFFNTIDKAHEIALNYVREFPPIIWNEKYGIEIEFDENIENFTQNYINNEPLRAIENKVLRTWNMEFTNLNFTNFKDLLQFCNDGNLDFDTSKFESENETLLNEYLDAIEEREFCLVPEEVAEYNFNSGGEVWITSLDQSNAHPLERLKTILSMEQGDTLEDFTHNQYFIK